MTGDKRKVTHVTRNKLNRSQVAHKMQHVTRHMRHVTGNN